MSDEAYLSTIWYRVARLTPRLRPHIKVQRHRYRGQSWYVLYDHATGRIHRFTPAAWMLIGQLDGTRTVDEVWQAVAESQEAEAPSQDEVIQLLSRLHQNDLIQYRSSPDIAELLERYNRQSRQLLKQNLTNPVGFRVPLWDPDRFLTRSLPWVRPLTGWFGLVLWAVVVLAGLASFALNWERFTFNIADQLLSFHNLLIMAVAYPFIKAFHELAHGYLAKARGGEIRETGIMFLVFFPVPYVDASSSGAFANKWDRAAVAAGGIFAETFVAAVAMLVWASVEPGMVSAVAWNIVLIGGISTLIVNGNPLLKFDGYYVLSDLIESPNLGTRANKYWGWLVQRYAFGAKQIKPDPATPGEKVWFLIYAPASYVYRLVIMVGIALYVSTYAFVIGVIIALWAIFNAVVKPIAKNLRHVVTAPKLRKVRRRAVGLTFGGIAVAVGVAALIPLPLRTDSEGVVWLPEEAFVRARTAGFVADVPVAQGAAVEDRAALALLEEPTLAARLSALEWRAEEFRRRAAALAVTDRAEAEIARLQLEDALAELERERARGAELTVRAPLPGRFEPALPAASLVGRFVNEGDVIGVVLPARAEHVRVAVTQDDNVLVRERLTRVELKLAGHLEDRHEVRLIREVPSALDRLPSPALAQAAGGRFLTDPGDPEGLRVLQPLFLYDLALPEELGAAAFGTRVVVRFEHGHEPAAQQVWRRARQLFLRHFGA